MKALYNQSKIEYLRNLIETQCNEFGKMHGQEAKFLFWVGDPAGPHVSDDENWKQDEIKYTCAILWYAGEILSSYIIQNDPKSEMDYGFYVLESTLKDLIMHGIRDAYSLKESYNKFIAGTCHSCGRKKPGKKEFARKHSEKLLGIQGVRWKINMKDPEVIAIIKQARAELKYSTRTNDQDILNFLIRAL